MFVTNSKHGDLDDEGVKKPRNTKVLLDGLLSAPIVASCTNMGPGFLPIACCNSSFHIFFVLNFFSFLTLSNGEDGG